MLKKICPYEAHQNLKLSFSCLFVNIQFLDRPEKSDRHDRQF